VHAAGEGLKEARQQRGTRGRGTGRQKEGEGEQAAGEGGREGG